MRDDLALIVLITHNSLPQTTDREGQMHEINVFLSSLILLAITKKINYSNNPINSENCIC